MGDKGVVGRELVQPLLADPRQELDRVSVDLLPLLGVDADEQLAREWLPGPPQVVRDLAKVLESARETGDDREASEGGHGGDEG